MTLKRRHIWISAGIALCSMPGMAQQAANPAAPAPIIATAPAIIVPAATPVLAPVAPVSTLAASNPIAAPLNTAVQPVLQPVGIVQKKPDSTIVIAAPAPPNYTSILMTEEQVGETVMAANIYKKYSSGRQQELTDAEKSFMSQITGLSGTAVATGGPHILEKKREQKQYAYPQFFLEELDYHSTSDWLVQLSGRKIENATPQDKSSVQVVEVGKDAIKIKWTPMVLSKFTDHIPDPPDPHVVLETDHLLITLKPHQTFTSYAMRVVEGKVKAKIVTADAGDFPDGVEVGGGGDGKQPGGGKNAGHPGASGADTGDDTDGVNGLINMYQSGKGRKK